MCVVYMLLFVYQLLICVVLLFTLIVMYHCNKSVESVFTQASASWEGLISCSSEALLLRQQQQQAPAAEPVRMTACVLWGGNGTDRRSTICHNLMVV